MHDINASQSETRLPPEEEMESFDFEFAEDEEFDDELEYDLEEEWEGPLDESQEMELAAELLDISDEEELDYFLGGLLSIGSKVLPGVVKGVSGLFRRKKRRRRRRPTSRRRTSRGRMRALGGSLKGIAKSALPFLGSAVGSIVPGVGTAIGGALGSLVGNLFEAELEGVDGEERELEQARRFVRLATTAAQHMNAMPDDMDPRTAAKEAIKAATKNVASKVGSRGGRSGRWMRRGSRIILLGV